MRDTRGCGAKAALEFDGGKLDSVRENFDIFDNSIFTCFSFFATWYHQTCYLERSENFKWIYLQETCRDNNNSKVAKKGKK